MNSFICLLKIKTKFHSYNCISCKTNKLIKTKYSKSQCHFINKKTKKKKNVFDVCILCTELLKFIYLAKQTYSTY